MAGATAVAQDAKTRILIVEDDFLIALLLKEIAERLGYEVVGPLRRMQSAWEAARELPIDAALLDIGLEGGTALPVAKALQARHVPFGFITANARPLASMFDGDAPILTKPFDDDEVEKLLRRLLN